MHPQQLKKRAPRPIPSRIPERTSTRSNSYLKTRIRGSRLQNAARILAFIELSRRLHQAYRQAYDKQAADWLLPQNTTPGTIQDLRKSIYDDKELLEKINSCLKKLLGKNFNKVGEQTLANAPKIDARLTSNQIAAKFKMSAGPYATGAGHVGGTYGTIFIGKEWFSNPIDWTVNGRGGTPDRTPLQNAYVHELGNIASYIASGGTNYKLFGAKPAGGLVPTDDDSGYALQACVFNEKIDMKKP